ncbi:MAG: hypothetical protein AAF558_10515 [Verrucomicrobiota bacterium]
MNQNVTTSQEPLRFRGMEPGLGPKLLQHRYDGDKDPQVISVKLRLDKIAPKAAKKSP